MKKYAVLLCVATLCACMPKQKESAFYTLASSDVESVSDARVSVDVGRIKMPEYIDRSQMVTTSGVNVDVNPHNRWAESLGAMVQRKVITNIGHSLPRATVKDGNFMAPTGDYSVFVEVYNLDGELGGAARLVAIYSISDADGATLVTKNVAYKKQVGDDYAAYAGAVGELVDELSHDIAVDLGRAARDK